METQSSAAAKNLLDLPAELRNHIWTAVFEEDDIETQPDILTWNSVIPSSSILRVNRQTRSECQSLYEQAILDLGNNHQWIFCIDSRFSRKSHREDVKLELDRLPRRLPITFFSVVFDFPVTHLYGPRPSIAVDFNVNHQGVAGWGLTPRASAISRYRSSVVENVLRIAIAGRLAPTLTLDEDPRWLDVRQCIGPFFQIFDDIRFFSALEFWEY